MSILWGRKLKPHPGTFLKVGLSSVQAKEKARARVAKNCLFVTLMSLNAGYGSLVERYQSAELCVAALY